MKTINAIISVATGAVLSAGALLTAPNGPSEEDISCYNSAMSLQSEADEIGFANFDLTDYPIAFCDGKHDYLLTSHGSGFETKKRAPVIETIAATAYENDGAFEVIVPTKDSMGILAALTGGEWDELQQACTIWHEAFHCHQFTLYFDNITSITNGRRFGENDFGEPLINKEYSENARAKELFTEQLTLLSSAANETDIDKIRELIVQYKELDEQRTSLLSEDAVILENYYTMVEGTAFYVEMNICKSQDEGRYNTQYAGRMTDFADGSSKYYTLGAAQCLLFDRIDEDWKESYDFSVPMNDLIYAELGV